MSDFKLLGPGATREVDTGHLGSFGLAEMEVEFHSAPMSQFQRGPPTRIHKSDTSPHAMAHRTWIPLP